MGTGFAAWLSRRLCISALVLAVVGFVVFLATNLLPANIVDQILGNNATPEARRALTVKLGLDEPPLTRYWSWAAGVLHGDFGSSLVSGRPVGALVWPHLLNSLLLDLFAVPLIVVCSVALGSLAALRRGRTTDRLVSGLCFAGLSMPEFVIGSLLVWIFSVRLGWLPALTQMSGSMSVSELLRALVLPVLTVAPVSVAYLTQTMRAATITVLDQEFVRTAPTRGLGRWRVLLGHVLPNAAIPMINVFTVNLAWLVGGQVVVETMFQYPGIGKLLLDSVDAQDVPTLQAAALLIGAIYVGLNLVADIAVSLLDPRVARSAA